MSAYMKTIAALVTGVLGWAAVVIASPSHAITSSEWLGLGVVAAQALGVYGVTNTSPARTVSPAVQVTTTSAPTVVPPTPAA